MKTVFLLKPSGLPLPLQIIDLYFAKPQNSPSECRLIFQVTPQLYQQIHAECLFNIKPEFCTSLNALAFHEEAKIEIEVQLQSQFLPQLVEYVTDSETTIDYLIACSQKSFSHKHSKKQLKLNLEDTDPNPLLLTESWLALSIQQISELGEIGYRTFWSYLNSVNLISNAIPRDQFSEAMTQFLKDRNEGNMAMAEQAISAILDEIVDDVKKKG